MSLKSATRDMSTESTSSSSYTTTASARVPLFGASSVNATSQYSIWRPQMETFLMRAGCEPWDYQEVIPNWNELVIAAQEGQRQREREGMALLLQPRSSSGSTVYPSNK